ncbi:MAG: hypothetical protein VR73_05230 [Gammaproteobacteria bacterium BRH_c0]|nr:MAG: hypothetical protein VR73_05230 [Gammaproteobacteria bacterium BRH_c0]
MGYSDIGAFGSEIATPHLDTLAASGVKLTNFHAAPTCSPTRSMLLTGTDNHTAGVGAMAEVPRPELAGRYGYEGKITDRVATIAERFRAAGYSTIMTGKWHLGMTAESIPSSRGFDKSFALLQGGHNHYGNSGFGQASEGPMAATYMDDGVRVDVPASFYSSDFFTTKLVEKIDAAGAEKPFFAFLSFTAPHSPLQAPKSLVRKYQGKYDTGWAQIRAERVARMKAMGLIGDNAVFDGMEPTPQSWETLNEEERRIAARNMEVYAAMIERLDWNVGVLREHLKATGRDKNTIFLFISDNGPAGQVAEDYMVVPSVQERLKSANNAMGNRGGPTSYVFYGAHWASAGSAPFRLHKGFVTDGGTRVPAIISGAGIERGGEQSAARATVMDVVPTLLDLTGIEAVNRVDGREVAAIRGRSMVPVLKGEAEVVHPADEAISFELHGQRTVVRGDWKLLSMPAPIGTGSWQLFDLASDPAERLDVSGQHPEIVAQLSNEWDSYATQTQVIVAPAH